MPGSCFACDRSARFAPVEGVSVCENCARRIALLARGAENGGPSDVWSLTAAAREHEKGTPAQPQSELKAEKVFAEFKKGVEKTISPNDAQAHLDLASAYSEMGLYGDALREAGIAALVTGASEAMRAVALKALLTAPLMQHGGLVALRRRLVADRRMN